MGHWPEWGMPLQNWRQQGSYVSAIEEALPDPAAGTLVCLPPINPALVPYIAGCLDQLRNPSSYIGLSDADLALSLQRADLLRGMLGIPVPCAEPTMFDLRLNACVLEQSTDGGSTWSAVAGWEGLAACLPSLATDAIAIPANPLGVSTIQQACNIAGYVAQQVIQGVFNTLQQAISEGRSAIQFATDLTVGAFIFRSVFPYTTAVLLGIDALLSLGASIGASELATIVADVVLWDDITCAIYHAILVDGHITAANWPAAIANIRAISYSVPGVAGGIADWLQSVDMATVYEWQQLAPLDSVDCTDCGWCYVFTGATMNSPAWTPDVGLGDATVVASFPGGVATSLTFTVTTEELHLYQTVPAGGPITSMRIVGNAGGAASGGTRGGSYASGHGFSLPSVTGPFDVTITPSVAPTHLEFVVDTQHASGRNTVSRIELHGTGTCPFGSPNC